MMRRTKVVKKLLISPEEAMRYRYFRKREVSMADPVNIRSLSKLQDFHLLAGYIAIPEGNGLYSVTSFWLKKYDHGCPKQIPEYANGGAPMEAIYPETMLNEYFPEWTRDDLEKNIASVVCKIPRRLNPYRIFLELYGGPDFDGWDLKFREILVTCYSMRRRGILSAGAHGCLGPTEKTMRIFDYQGARM